MTVHDHVGDRLKQKLGDHCVVGYDPMSERPVYALKIPKSKADLLKRFVHFEPDDPKGYDSYKIEYADVVKLLHSLGQYARPRRRWSISSDRGCRTKASTPHHNVTAAFQLYRWQSSQQPKVSFVPGRILLEYVLLGTVMPWTICSQTSPAAWR